MNPIFFAFTSAVLLSTATASGAASPAAPGEILFRQRCIACHTAEQPSPLAPSLTGVIGRTAGTTAFAYSPALKKSALKWTPANLDRFLTNPSKVVPGTMMVISVPVAADRQALITYLANKR
jgi:cytochrome c